MNSIKSKIIIFAVLATFIPSLGLGLLSFQQNETLINDNVTRELNTLANFASRELDLWVNEQIYAARALSTSNIIIDGLSLTTDSQTNKPNKQQALSHYLHSVHEKLDTIVELSVANVGGEVIASSAATPTTVTIPKPQNWPQNALMQGVVTSPPHWNKQHATATLSITVPILSYDAFILGSLVVTLDLQTIKSNLKNTTNSPPGEVLLLDSNGNVVLASYDGETNTKSLDPLLLQRLQKQPDKSEIFQGILKRKVIGIASMSETLPITVVAERDHKAVYAAWIQQRNLFLALVSVLILMVTAIALRMGHSIVVPLRHLIDATKDIVKGNLEVQLAVTQKDELGKLTQMFNQMTDRLRQNQSEILAANQAMQQKNQLLQTLSITDGLTGLYNRNKLNSIFSEQIARYERNKRPFSVLMIDVDHFKTLNDSLGHVSGDEILAAIARILSQSIRSVDFAARYGGDEFIIVLTETTVAEALKTAERIRSQVVDIHCKTIEKTVKVTLSIGIIECVPSDKTPTEVLSRADSALYEAKRAGRNQAYCIYP